jgi:hypothetical protein
MQPLQGNYAQKQPAGLCGGEREPAKHQVASFPIGSRQVVAVFVWLLRIVVHHMGWMHIQTLPLA